MALELLSLLCIFENSSKAVKIRFALDSFLELLNFLWVGFLMLHDYTLTFLAPPLLVVFYTSWKFCFSLA